MSTQLDLSRLRLHRLGAVTKRLPALCLGALLSFAPAPAAAQSPTGSPMTVGLALVATGLTSPVYLTTPPDDSGRLFVVDQVGLIRIVDATGTLLPTPFLDFRDRLVALRPGFDERGLLGLAFHPAYATNGRFFVYFSAPLRAAAPAGFDHTAYIVELQVSADPDLANPASERLLLQVDQPQFNHNGGTLAFGPDHYLYISLGDGGGANDVGLGHVEDWYAGNAGGNGQDVEHNLLGNILRLDVDSGDPYGIPADNPFAAGTGCGDGCDEIFAYGFRNPYRISFDMGGNHDLFVGDAGQNLWEEVSIVRAGENYGWNVREGTHCFDAANPNLAPAECPDVVESGLTAGDPLRDPVIEYANARSPAGGLGLAVIGGHVYRGRDLPQLRGRYVFGDFSRSFTPPDGSLFAASPRQRGLWLMQELLVGDRPDGRLGHYLLGFGQDGAGEVYVLTSDNTGPSGDTGRVYRLVAPGGKRR
jgi:glucose/arabinose dehydrogenase